MNLPVKIRRDWHYYAFAIGLIFILNGVVGLLGFEAQGWQTYAVGLVTWVISGILAGLHTGFQRAIRSMAFQRQFDQASDQIGIA